MYKPLSVFRWMLCITLALTATFLEAKPAGNAVCAPLEGVHKLTTVCTRRSPKAKCLLSRGIAYEFGHAGLPDPEQAAICYRAAVELGDVEASGHLAYLYWQGEGVKKDVAKAVELILPAAEAGYPRAQTNLGIMYLNGAGVERDLEKAAVWIGRGVDSGSTLAKQLPDLKLSARSGLSYHS